MRSNRSFDMCMYACMYVYMHACMYVYTHVCMHVCMYVCMYVHMYYVAVRGHMQQWEETQTHMHMWQYEEKYVTIPVSHPWGRPPAAGSWDAQHFCFFLYLVRASRLILRCAALLPHICGRTRICRQMCMRMIYIYIHVYVYIWIYIHTHRQTDTLIHTTMDIHLHAYICSQILEVDLHKTSTDM